MLTISRPITGNVVIGDGVGGADADILQLSGNDQIDQSASDTVTINSSGLFDLNDNERGRSATWSSTAVASTREGFSFMGNVTVNANAQTAIDWLGHLPGRSGRPISAVADGAAAIDLDLTGAINVAG